jgi:hypothetical protein
MIPIETKGWMILTEARDGPLFCRQALMSCPGAHNLETFWVFFETLAMPVVIFVFFLKSASS